MQTSIIPDPPESATVQPAESPHACTLEEEGRTAQPDKFYHWVLLCVSVAVLALSLVLRVHANEEQVLLPVVDVPLPGACTYKRWIGVECPGCGLTRCFISLAHGNVAAAWDFNPAGLLFFAIIAAQIPFRAIQLRRVSQGKPELRWRRIPQVPLGLLVLSLFVQWVMRTFVAVF